LLEALASMAAPPDIILLDVDMPYLDGPETAERLTQAYPAIQLVALSMKDDDTTIIRMIRAGCCAYLLKDIHPDELERALLEVRARGYYNADQYNLNYRRLTNRAQQEEALTDREQQFLSLACSDLTYKQIAAEMCLAERTIDGYRESLFRKMHVQSRVGMALEAVRMGMVKL
jgi:DNA-binding NarL/FixJ family response regulator